MAGLRIVLATFSSIHLLGHAVRARQDEEAELDVKSVPQCNPWCLAKQYNAFSEVPEEFHDKVKDSCEMSQCSCPGCTTTTTTPEAIEDCIEPTCERLVLNKSVKCNLAFQNKACAACRECEEGSLKKDRPCNETCATSGVSPFDFCMPSYEFDMCGGCKECCNYDHCREQYVTDGLPLTVVCAQVSCWRCGFCELFYKKLGHMTTTTTGTGPWCFDHCEEKTSAEQCEDFTCQACPVCLTTTHVPTTITTTTPNQCVPSCHNLVSVPWEDRCTLFQCMKCDPCQDGYVEVTTSTTTTTLSLDYCGFWCEGETEEQTKQACTWSADKCHNCTICEKYVEAAAEAKKEGGGTARSLMWAFPLAVLLSALRAS